MMTSPRSDLIRMIRTGDIVKHGPKLELAPHRKQELVKGREQ